MVEPPKRPNQHQQQDSQKSSYHSQKSQGQKHQNSNPKSEIVKIITDKIKNLDTLRKYPIRELVEQAELLGEFLKSEHLETNQIRKFLDAINRVKVKLNQDKDNQQVFKEIEPEIVLLKPKLAYAAARQKAAKPLSNVMSVAIDKVRSVEDFKKLVQFVESIIAYHKSAGGK